MNHIIAAGNVESAEPVTDGVPLLSPGWLRSAVPFSLRAVLHLALLAVAGVFFALHFVHLRADFPSFSRWMDWSKYTDEGWYGDAAIRHYLLGHWYVVNDFNPAVALPVWPFLEAIVFRFTGVSVIAARALTVMVFGASMVCSWLLIARSSASRVSWAGTCAIALLVASPFCFVFTRLAILEPLLVLLALLSLLAAQAMQVPEQASWRDAILANLRSILALGVLCPTIILTKTTGVFLLPAIAWMLFASLGYRPRVFLGVALPAGLIAGGLWLTYYAAFVRPQYLLDYQYLFSANAYTGISRSNWVSVIWWTIHGGAWIGKPVFIASMAASVVALASVRRLRFHPLIPTLIIWAGGYGAFLAYHNNLQPRYYLVVAVPLTLLVPVVFRDLVLPRFSAAQQRRGIVLAFAGFAAILVSDASQTIAFVRRPEYTFVRAANRISDYIGNDRKRYPAHNPLVLSISGSDLSLMTGLPSICDDFGTAELGDRVKQYKPGWYVAWNLIEDDKMDALSPEFHVERVATFPAMDDQDRNILILYRLDQSGVESEVRHRRRTGRSFRRKPGQQPSSNQLEH